MKQLLTTVFILFIAFNTMAQQPNPNPYPRTIQVAGSAEIEIIPDEIYVVVTLKEYEKRGVGKIDLEKIKSDFLGYCKAINLPDSSVSINTYEGHINTPWWRKKKNKDELYSSISYQVKFGNSKKMDELVAKLDEDATQNFAISKVWHSKMQEYRMKLKIEATKAARNKAGYMAEAVGEKIGEAVSIVESDEPMFPRSYELSQENVAFRYAARADAMNIPDQPAVDFKNIKLRYEVKATFALK
jgi:uncharacterized protein YggE